MERPTLPAPAMATRIEVLRLASCGGGGAARTASTLASSRSSTAAYTRSPSWKIVLDFGIVPLPIRNTNGTRAPVAASICCTVRPTQARSTCTSISRTDPDGSRHCGSEPAGSSRRSTWSDAQRTVATVGMPSRSYTSARPGS